MIEALLSKPKRITFRGQELTLRRPTVADLVSLVDAQGRGENILAWYIWNHVVDGGERVFASIDDVMRLDATACQELAKEIDKLYGEGSD